MFRQLEYQERALTVLDAYIDILKKKKVRADRLAELAKQAPDLDVPIPDFAEDTWSAMKANGWLPRSRDAIPFSPRKDDCCRPVPNVVLKVPTGGGKTWLAVSAVSRIMGRYLDKNTGFVLWIVPSEAIYSQTLRHLKDRQHPYRQALDRVGAGHVRVMEKTDRLDVRDLETNLCVMLLMLQSASKQTKETLKMFRDRGDVHGFFPPEGNQQAHEAALAQTPNLDCYGSILPMIKDSLGNALRVIRPVVVLDEGHRAISDLAAATLYGFNPCFVLELTATPRDVRARGGKKPKAARYANVLVEVTGLELDREGMIKMPLNLEARQGDDWRATLNSAFDKLNTLAEEARGFRANTNRYIRPILLIQVERTGADQRDGGHIHAEDAKDWLLAAGFDEAEIAVKTAERNDLMQPENLDLMWPMNQVRAIITKQALQEGWDCPFAYVLCALAASTNRHALTQLVGRILRQPGAMKTGIPALDECHIITHHVATGAAVDAIKKGLERDGLGDLVLEVAHEDPGGAGDGTRKIDRRPKFESTEIYLPKVMISDGATVRELDYETDILSRVDWGNFDPDSVSALVPKNAPATESQIQRITLAEDGGPTFSNETVAESREVLTFDPAYAVRMTMDIVPNPFVGREIVGRLLDAFRRRGFDDRHLGRFAGRILEELRKSLSAERDARAETLFRQEVISGRIQFRLRLDGDNWRMPLEVDTTEPVNAPQVVGSTGAALERSLFAPVYRNDFNNDERDVAVYLDSNSALTWWHRNVARSMYGIQGWKKHKVYPDFLFAQKSEGGASDITVLETKGEQLAHNLDTTYKRDLLAFLSNNFTWDDCTPAGQLELVRANGETVHCILILMSEWEAKLKF